MWYIRWYFTLLFGKTLWTTPATWILLAICVWGIFEVDSERRAEQAVRSTLCFVGIIMSLTFLGMLMGFAKRRWEKKEKDKV
jgi:bacteriorhodopsin